jgi:hypothetical protein
MFGAAMSIFARKTCVPSGCTWQARRRSQLGRSLTPAHMPVHSSECIWANARGERSASTCNMFQGPNIADILQMRCPYGWSRTKCPLPCPNPTVFEPHRWCRGVVLRTPRVISSNSRRFVSTLRPRYGESSPGLVGVPLPLAAAAASLRVCIRNVSACGSVQFLLSEA